MLQDAKAFMVPWDDGKLPADHPRERYQFNPLDVLGGTSFLSTAVLLAVFTWDLASVPSWLIGSLSCILFLVKGLTGSLTQGAVGLCVGLLALAVNEGWVSLTWKVYPPFLLLSILLGTIRVARSPKWAAQSQTQYPYRIFVDELMRWIGVPLAWLKFITRRIWAGRCTDDVRVAYGDLCPYPNSLCALATSYGGQ